MRRFSKERIIIREHADATQVDGTLDTQDKPCLWPQEEWTLMTFSGNPIGHAVEEDGMKKDARELIIKDLFLKNIKRLLGNLFGLIGEFRHTSKRLCPLYGRKSLNHSIIMIKTH